MLSLSGLYPRDAKRLEQVQYQENDNRRDYYRLPALVIHGVRSLKKFYPFHGRHILNSSKRWNKGTLFSPHLPYTDGKFPLIQRKKSRECKILCYKTYFSRNNSYLCSVNKTKTKRCRTCFPKGGEPKN